MRRELVEQKKGPANARPCCLVRAVDRARFTRGSGQAGAVEAGARSRTSLPSVSADSRESNKLHCPVGLRRSSLLLLALQIGEVFLGLTNEEEAAGDADEIVPADGS